MQEIETKHTMNNYYYSSISFFLFLLSTVSVISAVRFQSQLSDVAVDRGRKVGGWTVVPHVESNEEVQQLGRFCVEEYNQRQHIPTATWQRWGDGGGGDHHRHRHRLLSFSGVVAAERQVVSGIKYYLKVKTFEDDDDDDVSGGKRGKIFDAVVVVKPWVEDKERELLSFKPAAVGY